MTKISDLPDELLVKILSFLPTKDAVSTSILSKQWEFLWMWLPSLKFNYMNGSVRDFINKNLPLHRAPIINSFCLSNLDRALEVENFKSWVEIVISHCIRELAFMSYSYGSEMFLVLPSSLYTCNSLVTLELQSPMLLVDVPRTVCLPSLKTLQLIGVVYSNEDSLEMLLSGCPILEDLTIVRRREDNLRGLLIEISSLQRLSIIEDANSDFMIGEDDLYGCMIITPSLKYLLVEDYRSDIRYSIEHMPELEEADIFVLDGIYMDELLKSITTVKCLSVFIEFNNDDEIVYGDGIVFNKPEKLKFYIRNENWSKILCQLLKDSPNLQILDIESFRYIQV